MSDLSNWTRSTTDGRKYNKTMKLKVGSDRRGNELRRAGSSRSVRQKIRVEGDINTGDYTIFATGTKELGGTSDTDIEIMSYDASKNKFTVSDQGRGKKYYDSLIGSMVNDSGNSAKKRSRFHSDIRVGVFGLAKVNQGTKSEKKYFKDLRKLEGYKSANNIIFTGAPQVPPDAGDQRPTSLAAQPTRVDSAGSEFVGPTTPSRQLMFAIEETVQGEYIPPEADPGTRPAVSTRETPNTDIDPYYNEEGVLVITTVGDPSEVEPVQNDPDSTDTSAEEFSYLRYPKGTLPDLGYDYIQITAYKYEPVGLPAKFNDPDRNKKAEDRLYKSPLNTIQLPMIGSISETNAVNWTDDQVNEINNIAAGIAYNNIKSVVASKDPANPFSATINAFKDSIGSAQEAIKSADVRKAVAAYFAGQAASVPNILQRAEGRMINNNLELLFNGPSLRSFNFNFKFRPRSPDEADEIRKIIRAFKINSAPVRSADFMFLATPNIFRIQYIYNQDVDPNESRTSLTKTSREHPYMNRIKPCALVGMNVNYTPEGSYMTYSDGGSMTGYDLSLSFKELEPIYKDDHANHKMGY